MKKLIIAAAAVFLTASFTACTKDNSVNPTSVTAKKLAGNGQAKNDIGQAD